ncbi:hypothetical protein CFOL_v3_14695 [Cephalotus follicularis]|uniref:RALF domain-containing protein n=1 Tax=Cephalotus follicularis TaxID=3775 RepID=A0A1Q3BTB3_CEPFO|nr:hypothetical protein CFOL_v3_14695 [Cephalotus follicularis]
MRVLNIFLAILLFLCLLHAHPCKGRRVLHDDGELENISTLKLQSLQRGPVTPSDPSGCTNIPGGSGPRCPFKEMNFARGALPRAGAYPSLNMVPFGVATNQI